MPLVDVRSLILHAFPYGDTSRILRILTPGLGVRSVIAKGAQRPKSRFGGILEPFTEGVAHFNLRDGRDLFTLSGFSLIRSRQGIGRDLAAFSGASLIAEIVIRAGTEEPHPSLFDLVIHSFDELADSPPDASRVALRSVWNVVALLGFQPETSACVHCGREFDSDEATRFDVVAGGTACRVCRPAGRLVDSSVREDLRRMSGGDDPTALDRSRSLHVALLEAFLTNHLAPDRPFRALPLFLDNLR